MFPVVNSFYLGAYQTCINEGADLLGLSEKESLERDCFVYRSYIALGSYQVRSYADRFCTVSWLDHQNGAPNALYELNVLLIRSELVLAENGLC